MKRWPSRLRSQRFRVKPPRDDRKAYTRVAISYGCEPPGANNFTANLRLVARKNTGSKVRTHIALIGAAVCQSFCEL